MRFVLLLLLAGCTTRTYFKEVRMQDGTIGYTVDCTRSKSQCFQRASLACGEKGYTIFDEDTADGFVASGSAARSTHHKSMLIKCKP